MICFVNGHPYDQKDIEALGKRGLLEAEVMKLCISLCPEKYSPKVRLVKVDGGKLRLLNFLDCEWSRTSTSMGVAQLNCNCGHGMSLSLCQLFG
jgi:hypothetical protein